MKELHKGKNFFLLMMGGKGVRYGAQIPKQFIEIDNKPIFMYILDTICNLDYVDGIVVVSHKDWITFIEEKVGNRYKKFLKIVQGGECRSESVFNGLAALESIASVDDNVLIHDATHPHLDVEKLPQLIDKINEFSAATMVTSEYDTCYIKNSEMNIEQVIDRKSIAVGASPEGFKFGLIYPFYKNATKEEMEKMTSAGAMIVENGNKMATVNSDLLNLKITYPQDMELFKILCKTYYYKG